MNIRDPRHNPTINIKRVMPSDKSVAETQPFVAFVPTYLTGGNWVDGGDTEIMTNSLREYIASFDNANYCQGIVGSDNRNFNTQYCLTARMYAKQFEVPFLGGYELRGTDADVKRIYDSLAKVAVTSSMVS